MCVYISSLLQVKVLPGINHPDVEMIWLEIHLEKLVLLLGCVYRPPASNVNFWSNLESSMEGLEGANIILVGDFNVDLLNTSDPNRKHLHSLCCQFNLLNIIDSPTRLSSTSAKCIDLILTNNNQVRHPKVIPVHFSDHSLVLASLHSYGNSYLPKQNSHCLSKLQMSP